MARHYFEAQNIKKKFLFAILALLVASATSLTLACRSKKPDSNITYWFNESVYITGLLRFTGMVFINENTAQIIYFDENNVMQIDKGEYIFFDFDLETETYIGSFFYDSIDYYRLRFEEVYEYNQPEAPFPLTEDDIKDALFREGGIELLFRLSESTLEVFGLFSHQIDIGLNLLNFQPITLQEFQRTFPDFE